MIAVIKTGGKQYAVKAGQILKVEKISGKKGDSISLNDVLSLSDSSTIEIGNPLLKGATVEAKILDQIRDKKIIVFKKRRRQNYRLTRGHRQYLTVLKIESIKHGDKKSVYTKPESSNANDIKKEKIKSTIKKTSSKITSSKKIIKKKVKKKKISTKKTEKKK